MEQSAWPEVAAAIAAAPYPVQVLPADPPRARACLAALGLSTTSWFGALVANTGDVLIDHGWIRVLGSGHDRLPDVISRADAQARRLTVGYDVLGGQFAWVPAESDRRPTVHYFGPDKLGWLDLEQGYADWLHAMLHGAATAFYDTVRWPGWQTDVASLALDQGFSVYPPPFTVEGRNLASVSRRAVTLAELVSFYQDAAQQLGLASG